MKRILILALVIAFAGSAARAQAPKDTTLVIAFDKTLYDYGTIVRGSDGTCVFTFTNSGKTPLILNNVSATCGCTVPSWTREPVAPGAQGTISVKYNTNIVGNFTKSVTVYSNARNSPQPLTIKGTVTAQ